MVGLDLLRGCGVRATSRQFISAYRTIFSKLGLTSGRCTNPRVRGLNSDRRSRFVALTQVKSKDIYEFALTKERGRQNHNDLRLQARSGGSKTKENADN